MEHPKTMNMSSSSRIAWGVWVLTNRMQDMFRRVCVPVFVLAYVSDSITIICVFVCLEFVGVSKAVRWS
jgi:hypothetical protein